MLYLLVPFFPYSIFFPILFFFLPYIFSDLLTPSFLPAISLDNDSYWLSVFNYKYLKWIRYNWASSVSINKKQLINLHPK